MHNAGHTYVTMVIASYGVLLIFCHHTTLAPTMGIQIDRQIDFWLLWFGTMLLLALPVCYLEIALAKRSKTTALNALSSLTREADSSLNGVWLAGLLLFLFLSWRVTF